MRLYLSSQWPWNSTYSDDHRRLFYKASSSYSEQTTTIYRSLPDITLPTSERQLWEERHFLDTHPSWSEHPEQDGQGSGLNQDDVIHVEPRRASTGSDHAFTPSGRYSPADHHVDHPFYEHDHWVHFADIEFHTIHSTKLNIKGKEISAGELFRKEGWSFFGRNRIFTHEGQEYQWQMGERNLKLLKLPSGSNASPVLVAYFTPTLYDTTRNTRSPPCLDITSGYEELSDLIVVTFIYLERLREDRQQETSKHSRRTEAMASAAAHC